MATKPRPISLQLDPPVNSLASPDNEPTTSTSPAGDDSTKTTASARRHAKGLSLNFPILLPTTGSSSQFSVSPTTASALATPIGSTRSSPHTRAVPFRVSDTIVEVPSNGKARGSADFLTLLAAQERKVLELKEELHKAQVDLLGLKKQWASYEANKKKEEVKHVKKLQPLVLDEVTTSDIPEEEIDEERRRKKALVERSLNNTNNPDVNSGTSNLGRRGSKRVFEGRHTRTLSLLSPTSTKPYQIKTSIEADEVQTKSPTSLDREDPVIGSSLSRMATLDGLISADPLQFGFGKTYKDLAAHRRSLPPVPTDLLVRQGRQVYDGVREGLWTFFEDIRQATVGEEGVSGTAAQQRPQRATQRKPTKKSSDKSQRAKANNSASRDSELAAKEPSFWNEFGIDTPHKSATTPPAKVDKINGHVQSKRSTDSSSPPSLLPDSNDEEVEDAWDAWDSPESTREHIPESGKKGSNESLPRPEIQKLTPSKLTRTVSDLMREWDSGEHEQVDETWSALHP
ncbi:uncharacterized protein A1O9_01447 [Exophiala aquamarina CBS 119918]|uniref:DUF4048 domain-containing protein n=1 Tax=Exophiala aquamarina CBS 119918 TaxID=1182545 RepID=A0A072PTN7_9EURO|nr:uncharacterized protein A1O9_01447 [Exophiala aquamarina CBS 119918]KEF63469.1 hypothetical protein A1O9_01447 [Exophiala aquamarina CBS 119918]